MSPGNPETSLEREYPGRPIAARLWQLRHGSMILPAPWNSENPDRGAIVAIMSQLCGIIDRPGAVPAGSDACAIPSLSREPLRV